MAAIHSRQPPLRLGGALYRGGERRGVTSLVWLRLSMSHTASRIAFIALATIGAAIWLLAVGLHLAGSFTGHIYEIDHTVLLVGGIFGFVGFFGMDSKRATAGATVIVDGTVRILSVLPRFGRRSTDALAVPSTTTVTDAVPIPEIQPNDQVDK